MARKLRKLQVASVDVVDRGAAGTDHVRPAIRLMKRDVGFNDAGELTVDGVPRWRRKRTAGAVAKVDAGDIGANDSLERAKREIAENLAVAKSLAAMTEDHQMEAQVDVVKATAVAVIKRFDDKVEEIAKRHSITRGAALLKVAADREMAADWFAYRQAQQLIGPQYRAASEPEPVVVSDAFLKLQKRARKLQEREPNLSEASAFAKAYSDPANRDLVEADRAFHFNKATRAA